MKTKAVFFFILALQVAVAQAQWSGTGEAGLIKASGNTTSETYNVGLGFVNEVDVWSHKLGFNYHHASSDNLDSAKFLLARYDANRDISERRYLFAGLNYLDDEFDGFTEQASAIAGLGYHAIQTASQIWDVGIGVGYRDTSEELADGTEGKDLSGETLVLLSSYDHQLTETTQFIDSFRAEIGSENTYIENDLALVVSMSEKLALKAGILWRNNSDPAPGTDKSDTVTTLNLVYNFD